MNRSLAAIAASALLAASMPVVSFAQSASSESSVSSVSSASSTSSVSSASSVSSSSSVSSVSSSSSSSSSYKRGEEWKKKCEDLAGLKKAQCIVKHNPGKGNKKDAVQRRNDDKVLRLSAKCSEKMGLAKVACMRKIEKKATKMRTDGKEMKRTIRGKLQD